MVITHNIDALRLCRYMNYNSSMMGKAMERLSSGLRINSAADDPAGLGISERMRAQIRGMEVAARNTQDGISAIQVADGAAGETHSILQRMRELAVQAANDTCTTEDRKNIQIEIDELAKQIDSIGNDTEFNTLKLLNSDASLYIQVGANGGQSFIVNLQDITTKGIKIDGNVLDVTTHDNASDAIKTIDDAINKVSSFRGSLGAQQNALEYRNDYLNSSADILTEAESRIRDADMAKEMMSYAKYSILLQVTQALFAQANKKDESIIELLKSL